MSLRLLFLLLMLPSLAMAQVYRSHHVGKDRLVIETSDGTLHVRPLSDVAIRIQLLKGEPEGQDLILVNKVRVPQFSVKNTSSTLKFTVPGITVSFDKQTGTLEYAGRNGKVFLTEKPAGRKLTRKDNGTFVAEQTFLSPQNEQLLGLGQFQDGHLNLRNVSRKLIQVNTQIAIPFIYSNQGYGLLWHQYGISHFNPADNPVALEKSAADGSNTAVEVTTTSGTQRVSQQQAVHKGTFTAERDGEYIFMLDMGNMENRHFLAIDGKPVLDQENLWLPPAASTRVSLKAGQHAIQVICKNTNTPKLSWKLASNETTIRSDDAKALDYVVFAGDNADEVIGNYRNLSGNVPMLPKWAYGFWQCRERYTSGDHLVNTVEEFRRRKLPLDVIVQDWQYWGKHGWGVPQFDTAHYPKPDQFIRRLHDLDAHFSISVWENLDKKSEVARDYISRNLYIPNSPWIDIFNPETRQTHWNALNKNLFSLGVDSWWMDATEPENDALTGKSTFLGPGDHYRLVYPLYVSQAVYDGQRATDPNKRVAILTRSAFPGQQRYGTINWSGDIGWNWDTYKRQIVAGLNYAATGMPFWTTDIGGFFRPGRSQYTDKNYQDILTRWFQWGTFNPIFRIHGYQSETEPWKYGPEVEDNMRKMMNLRYRLLPYIYSEAWQVTSNGSTIMRPLVMDFRDDQTAIDQRYEYLFGKSILVAPVTGPDVREWEVYLPGPAGWYDFWTGKRFAGGELVKAAAPQDKIPLFVKAGSIIPLGPVMQHTAERPADTLEIRIYTGADARFELYEDEGDNYNYEKGKYLTIPFQWNEATQTLTIGKQKGRYSTALGRRTFNLVFVSESNGGGTPAGRADKKITYTGKRLVIPSK
jgi:alpha-D-xyloside xylohydrolase